jgi:hypothetical protein
MARRGAVSARPNFVGKQKKGNIMSKKLMMLAAGALSVLAFTALPSAASAGEWHLKCEKFPCTFTVAGGESRFSETAGGTVWCSSVTGAGEVTKAAVEPTLKENESTTGTVRLLFHGCKEQATIFHFACTSAGQPSGTVTTNVMTTHNVWLTHGTTKPGVAITNANTTFTCAGGFAASTVTGTVLGELHEPQCKVASATQKQNFTSTSHGHQTWKQITGTGPILDLITSTNHTNAVPTYETAAQTGTGTLTFNQKVTPTC